MQKTQATKLERLKQAMNAQKTGRGSQATTAFQASKETKTPKVRPW